MNILYCAPKRQLNHTQTA